MSANLTQNDAREVAIFRWYLAHKDHVERLVKSETASYVPTGSDAIRPDLWKAAHWNHWLGSRATNAKQGEGNEHGR